MTPGLWQSIRDAAQQESLREPALASFLHNTVLRHNSLCAAISFLLTGIAGSIF